MLNDLQERSNARVPDSRIELRFGLMARLQLFILERRANALLKKTLRRHATTRSAQLSPHLLKDIGLPPDMHL